jgi:hypothetical protein
MRKSDLVAVFGTLQAIGDLFAPFNKGEPLTKGAVSQWDEEIPELREYQLRELMPDINKRIAAAKRNPEAKAGNARATA